MSPTLRPSSLGYWQWSEDGSIARWRWLAVDPAELRILDRTYPADDPRSNVLRQTSFRLELREDPDRPLRFEVSSCGASKGGTRHRTRFGCSEATSSALEWLDRRYRVLELEPSL